MNSFGLRLDLIRFGAKINIRFYQENYGTALVSITL